MEHHELVVEPHNGVAEGGQQGIAAVVSLLLVLVEFSAIALDNHAFGNDHVDHADPEKETLQVPRQPGVLRDEPDDGLEPGHAAAVDVTTQRRVLFRNLSEQLVEVPIAD